MQAPEDTEVEVRRKMQQLQIEGFSSMGDFTSQDHLMHLGEIERIIAGRKAEPGPRQSDQERS